MSEFIFIQIFPGKEMRRSRRVVHLLPPGDQKAPWPGAGGVRVAKRSQGLRGSAERDVGDGQTAGSDARPVRRAVPPPLPNAHATAEASDTAAPGGPSDTTSTAPYPNAAAAPASAAASAPTAPGFCHPATSAPAVGVAARAASAAGGVARPGHQNSAAA